MADGSTYDGVFAPDGNTSDWMAKGSGTVLSGGKPHKLCIMYA
jgi:hypothetical protein